MWIKEDQRFLFNIPNYKLIIKKSKQRSGGSGIFIKYGYDYEVINNLGMEMLDCEDVWILLKSPNNKDLIVGSIYRHPHNDLNNFEVKFLKTLDYLNLKDFNYVIGGDFNIDLLRNDSFTSNYKNNFISHGCTQIIEDATRFSHKNTPAILDHLYTNLNENKFKVQIIQSDISDHLPIFSTLDFGNFRKNIQKLWKRDYRNFDINKFNNKIEEIGISALNDVTITTNELCQQFFSAYESLLDKYAPKRPLSKNKLKNIKRPWIDHNLLKIMRQKNNLYRKYLRNKSDNNSKRYKKVRNTFNHESKKAKQLYYKKLFGDKNINSSTIWKQINKLINLKAKNDNSIKEIILEDGSKTTDISKISNNLNNSFIQRGQKIADQIKKSDTTIKTQMSNLILPLKNSIYLSNITSQELKTCLKKFAINKTTPSNCAPIWIMRESTSLMLDIIAEIFNRCLCQGIFPAIFKTAEVIPIFKTGLKTNLQNYRPISLLNPFSKLFEKCIYVRLSNFFKIHKTINNNQFGFKTNCSTENAILKTVSELSLSLDKNEKTLSLFLDLQKAFETVNHKILLNKLNNYGIRGQALTLIRSYLNKRRQHVLVNGFTSKEKDVACGIPQGSILGPLFFVIYINDLFCCSNFKIHLFADDAYLSMCDSSFETLEERANKNLETINNWLSCNKLSLNATKSTFILFSKTKPTQKIQLKIGNTYLYESDVVKYLGITLDKNLSWIPHITNVKNKVARACWVMSRIKKLLSKNTLKTIYFSSIYPHLLYSISSWGSVPLSRMNHLMMLQKRAIRIISNVNAREHTTNLFYKLHLLKLPEIYKLRLIIIMYKINKGTWIGNLNLTKVDSIHNYKTRLSVNQNFSLPAIRTNLGKKSFSFMGPQAWSNISNEVKILPPNLFKKTVLKSMLETYKNGND